MGQLNANDTFLVWLSSQGCCKKAFLHDSPERHKKQNGSSRASMNFTYQKYNTGTKHHKNCSCWLE